ncbi:MAG: hypothetical protein PVJ03_12100 [Chromatiaceae bacterium]|jgi:hypothetical protein
MTLAPWASADPGRVIELTDGSRISGDIVDYSNGIYTIESESLGRLLLDDVRIRSIRSGSPGFGPPDGLDSGLPAPAALSQLEQIRHRIISNPDVLAQVMSLQQDPDLIAILNDPQIMQAVMSGQIGVLQNHPKINQLQSNPTVRSIMRTLNP